MKKIIFSCFLLIYLNAAAQTTIIDTSFIIVPDTILDLNSSGLNSNNQNNFVSNYTPLASIITDPFLGGAANAQIVKDSWVYSGCVNTTTYIGHFINVREDYDIKSIEESISVIDVSSQVQSIIDNHVISDGYPTILYFPKGTYFFGINGIKLNGTNNNKNNIIIKGDVGSNLLPCKTEFFFQFQGMLGYHDATIKMNNTYNCGIEDIIINRHDYGWKTSNSNGIEIINSSNCWVKGVESINCIKNHILLHNSQNITISGCYFNDTQYRGDGGEGYGVLLQGTTHFCLIEDNYFYNLRHAIVLQHFPHQNVISYNFAYSSKGSVPVLGTIDLPDLSFHGRHDNNYAGPSWNLLEGNKFKELKFDMSHKSNGPYNTFFRSYASYFSVSYFYIDDGTIYTPNENQYKQNVVGSHTPDLSNTDLASLGLYLCPDFICFGIDGTSFWANNHFSYYRTSKPDFLTNWPFNPLTDVNGAQVRSFPGNVKVKYEGWDKYNICDLNITSNKNWDNEKIIRNKKIVVHANATLTLTNCFLKLPKNGSIIVKQGGKLIIDASIIIGSHGCEDAYYNWEGITVEGDKTKSQFDLTKHGVVELKNNSIIHSAITGIKTKDINNPNLGGGIIKAYNSNFINNQVSIKLNPYQNKSITGSNFFDLSSIKKCTFAINNEYKNPTIYPFNCFVELNSINGIDIKGCSFRNMRPDIAADFSNAGIGIKSTESDFTVDNFINQSEFYNLQYGIKSISTNLLKHFMVKNTYFENNFHGIYSYNSYNNWFTGNTFKIPDYYVPGTNNSVFSAYGLYLDHCSDYIVEGNSFNKLDYLTNATYGLIINESGAKNNTVYNNFFQNMSKASTQAQGLNRNNPSSNEVSGLQILCNTYSVNQKDIVIAPYDPFNSSVDGIAKYQGAYAATSTVIDLLKPAGNIFTNLGPTSHDLTDIKNGCTNLTYFHHQSFNYDDIWVPIYSNQSPVVYKANTNANFPTDKTLACPGRALQTNSTEPILFNNVQLTNLFNQKSAQVNSSKLIYNLWVDGGNTEGLKQDIKLALPWESYVLYNDLLINSPKLSEEVLVDAIKREDVLSPLMLKLILLANPHAVRSERVWEALNSRVNPLPETMIDEIRQGLEVSSQIETLQADISYYENEQKSFFNLLKQSYLSDTTGNGMQNLIQLLSSQNDIESSYELIFAKVLSEDYEGAAITLSLIENKINAELQPEELDRFEKMNSILPIIISVSIGNSTWNTISESDKNVLINLSESDRGITGAIATAARLKFDSLFVYQEPIYIINDNLLKMANGKKITKIQSDVFRVYPNPANDYIELFYNFNMGSGNLHLIISDALGKNILEKILNAESNQLLLSIKDFAKGNYFCTLYNNGKQLKTIKFVKQ